MTGIKIIAMNRRGTDALMQHEREQLRAPWHQRRVFDGLYKQSVLTTEPLTIIIEHKNARVAHLIPFDSMIVPIKAAMLENGAVINVDYRVERL